MQGNLSEETDKGEEEMERKAEGEEVGSVEQGQRLRWRAAGHTQLSPQGQAAMLWELQPAAHAHKLES